MYILAEGHREWTFLWFIQKFPKFEFCVNGYEYIEIPIGISPHTLLESLWQAVVGFIVGERISIVVFP
jgi:hypothetical protein